MKKSIVDEYIDYHNEYETKYGKGKMLVLMEVGSFYEAYATSSACTKGIASMRIYSANNVTAYSVSGAHLETFIKLAPGTYNTVVQAWDNCGGVSKTPITLTVTSIAGVSVFLPNTTS